MDDDRPLKIINAQENISAAIMRLQTFEDRFLYVIKFLDKDISNYLLSHRKLSVFTILLKKSTGIKIIYIIIVALLLFVSITIAIGFHQGF